MQALSSTGKQSPRSQVILGDLLENGVAQYMADYNIISKSQAIRDLTEQGINYEYFIKEEMKIMEETIELEEPVYLEVKAFADGHNMSVEEAVSFLIRLAVKEQVKY